MAFDSWFWLFLHETLVVTQNNENGAGTFVLFAKSKVGGFFIILMDGVSKYGGFVRGGRR